MEKEKYNKMKKAELIEALKTKEQPVLHNHFSGNITVDGSRNTDDSEAIKDVAKALLNITEYFNRKSTQPMYGVYVDSNGNIKD